MSTENFKQRFYKVFANLPLNLREEVILVVEKGPITWQVAYLEIDNDTESEKTILEKLAQLEFI